MKKTVKVPASIEVIKDAKELAQVQGGRKRPGRAKFKRPGRAKFG